MLAFISQSTENGRTKFLIDTNIFPVEISMKAAYAFLDRAYFLFKKDGENLVVQIHPKPWQELSGEHFALEFSDELLATYLRAKIEEENIEPSKEQILQNIKQAVKEVNLIKAGKLKARDARGLINEL